MDPHKVQEILEVSREEAEVPGTSEKSETNTGRCKPFETYVTVTAACRRGNGFRSKE